MVKVKNDLTGKRFGRLTVLRQVEDYIDAKGVHIPMWLVQCDCGSLPFTVRGASLKRGNTKSCGCLKKEKTQLQGYKNKKYNTYDLSGEYGIGWTSNTNEEFWFDLEDYDKIKDYCWMSDGEYVATDDIMKKRILLHRLVMDVAYENSKSFEVDHRMHPKGGELKYDNRKINLRIVTRSNNRKNHHTQSNNTSGVTGVSWDKWKNKWEAYIHVNGERKRIGLFDEDDFELAVFARKEAEEKYFGEYSFDNSQQAI